MELPDQPSYFGESQDLSIPIPLPNSANQNVKKCQTTTNNIMTAQIQEQAQTTDQIKVPSLFQKLHNPEKPQGSYAFHVPPYLKLQSESYFVPLPHREIRLVYFNAVTVMGKKSQD
jgi:hypothetical protein